MIVTNRTGSMHRRKFKGNSISADKKTDSGINKASSKNLSPSQKIIREFKKSEINKYGASPSCPDAPRTITTEWQVLYTTQLTKKAKKFHDGFLKLAICGSQRRQVMLYDETRRLLDIRFLKTNEMIRSGESLMLEGHLVDIGELEGDHEPLIYSNVQERNVNEIEKEIPDVQQVKKLKTQKNNPMEFKRSEISEQDASPSCPDTSSTSGTEWAVLYTTQLTQKAKKFHDGILKLAHCGSQRRQVFLYDANRRLLDSRFLKSNEMISSAESLKLDCYLVEIGECEGDQKPLKNSNLQGKNCIAVGETKVLHEQVQSHANYPVGYFNC